MKYPNILKLKQKMIVLTILTVFTSTLTISSYFTHFSESKIAPEFEKIDENIKNINNNNSQPLTTGILKGKVGWLTFGHIVVLMF